MPESDSDLKKPWCLYLLECAGGVFYAGITNDLDARFRAHCAGTGAKYTRANKPLRILAVSWFENRSSASKAEWQAKQRPKSRKVQFVREAGQPFDVFLRDVDDKDARASH